MLSQTNTTSALLRLIGKLSLSLVFTSTMFTPGLVGAREVSQAKTQGQKTVKVFKSPYCGCCKGWEAHLKENGFKVEEEPVTDLAAVKKRYGVKPNLQSCHTGVVDGYVLEGHVPAKAIQKLLKDRPKVKGIAVAGMPMGSPGMEGPTKEKFDAIAFDVNGKESVFMEF